MQMVWPQCARRVFAERRRPVGLTRGKRAMCEINKTIHAHRRTEAQSRSQTGTPPGAAGLGTHIVAVGTLAGRRARGGGINRLPRDCPCATCPLTRANRVAARLGPPIRSGWHWSRCEQSGAQRSAGAAESFACPAINHTPCARCRGQTESRRNSGYQPSPAQRVGTAESAPRVGHVPMMRGPAYAPAFGSRHPLPVAAF